MEVVQSFVLTGFTYGNAYDNPKRHDYCRYEQNYEYFLVQLSILFIELETHAETNGGLVAQDGNCQMPDVVKIFLQAYG